MAEHDFLANMTVPPTHPGQVLADIVLPSLGIGFSDAANRVKLSERDFASLLSGERKVDPATANRIGELCGNGPRLWLNMQQVLDDWNALHQPEPESGTSSFSAGG